jgi:flagellin FlaB
MPRPRAPDAGFTGLEAAIVLIAFVVVAAVFGYVVTGTGMLTTQKSGEVIHQGLRQGGCSLALGGTVVAQADTSGTELATVDLYLENRFGDFGFDVDRIAYVISTPDSEVTIRPGDDRIATTIPVSKNGDRILEKGELARARLTVTGYSLGAGKQVTFTVQPSSGNALVVARTVPDILTANKHYELLT